MKSWVLKATIAEGAAITIAATVLFGLQTGVWSAVGAASGALYVGKLFEYVDNIGESSKPEWAELKMPREGTKLASYVVKNTGAAIRQALQPRLLIPFAAALFCAAVHWGFGLEGDAQHCGALLAGFLSYRAAFATYLSVGPEDVASEDRNQ